jgi:hypothetical protein
VNPAPWAASNRRKALSGSRGTSDRRRDDEPGLLPATASPQPVLQERLPTPPDDLPRLGPVGERPLALLRLERPELEPVGCAAQGRVRQDDPVIGPPATGVGNRQPIE